MKPWNKETHVEIGFMRQKGVQRLLADVWQGQVRHK